MEKENVGQEKIPLSLGNKAGRPNPRIPREKRGEKVSQGEQLWDTSNLNQAGIAAQEMVGWGPAGGEAAGRGGEWAQAQEKREELP